MITLSISKPEYQYDIYTLVKSFWPGEEILQNPEPSMEKKDFLSVNINGSEVDICIVSGEIFAADAEQKAFCGVESGKEWGEDGERETTDVINKKSLKKVFYDFLCEYTGKTLPWGNLTGIRPTKLILGMMKEEAAATGEEIGSDKVALSVKEKLFDMHRVGEEKASLGMEIALREEGIMQMLSGTDGYSIYIGIPFCPSTCLYCSFTSNPIFKWKDKMPEYLACLKKELAVTMELMGGKMPDTVYIGGGTPTTLSARELEILLGDIAEQIDFSRVKEFTVEAGRADSITMDKLKVMREFPVSRISVNPQTMKEETLRVIGRNHTVEDVKCAYAMAREAGFDNINMDTILGLPGETVEDVTHTFSEITKLAPESLTVHSLAIKRASKLKQWLETHEGYECMEHEKAMEIAALAAKNMGMEPYYLYRQKNMAGNLENTGYAKPGKYGLYNILIMEEVQSIVALGAGSVSKRVFGDGRIERCDNVKDVALYMEKLDEMLERKRALFGV